MSDVDLFGAPVPEPEAPMLRSAKVSVDGLYRYTLWRRWGDDDGPRSTATFIMLNPSTADAKVDDPTIRRCIGFAKALGKTSLLVLNLYAFRATKPRDLWQAEDPVGPLNNDVLDYHILGAATFGQPVIAAWGTNPKPERVAAVLGIPGARKVMHALSVTKDGHPGHPLYLPSTSRPVPWPT